MNDAGRPKPWTQRLGLSLIFIICGLLIFVLGSPYHTTLPTNRNPVYNIILFGLFLAATIVLYRVRHLRRYWKVAFAFAAAAGANWVVSLKLLNFIITASDPLANMAQDKLAQAIPIICVLLIFTTAAGDDWGEVYLQRGRLRLGLAIGAASFLLFAAMALLQSGNRAILQRIDAGAAGWILVFIFANAIMEELWFRGVFLKRSAPFVGAPAAIIVTAIAFGASHIFATYVSPAEAATYGAIVFGLGLANAYIMHKTDSVWGSVLFHAGYDLVIIAPIVMSMQ